MNRRAFFERAAFAASALALDPEQLLWTPGAKTIFIPPRSKSLPPSVGDFQQVWMNVIDSGTGQPLTYYIQMGSNRRFSSP